MVDAGVQIPLDALGQQGVGKLGLIRQLGMLESAGSNPATLTAMLREGKPIG